MLLGYVSDEYYAAIPDALVELRAASGRRLVVRSAPSGAVEAEVEPGPYDVCLACHGYGSKRVQIHVETGAVHHFRLLSDRLLGYAWPKWCCSGERVAFRMHAIEPYHLSLWRYGYRKALVAPLGWLDNHGPRASMQTIPDGHFVETGVGWDNGFGVHRQTILAPDRSGLYYFHARGESGAFFSFPLVVAPLRPTAAIAVLASTNTWNAYNPFGGRSNYILAGRMPPEPIVNAKSDLPRYRLHDYGEWRSNTSFDPLSFDRPEPANQVSETDECTSPIAGRSACHLAPAEWRLLAWLERQGYRYDLYADFQLHSGLLPLAEYRVLVLNTHPEYWSEDMYRRTKAWVAAGGKLLYLGGNGSNCKVEFDRDEKRMLCLNAWPSDCESRFHHAVESEANLLGVVYSDPGAMTAAPYQVVQSDHWAFAGTGLRVGDQFGFQTLHERCAGGASGHETDKITPHSPPNIVLLARGCNPDEGGAHLTFYETPGGGAVFSAGSITYPSGLLIDDTTSRITSNVLDRFLAR